MKPKYKFQIISLSILFLFYWGAKGHASNFNLGVANSMYKIKREAVGSQPIFFKTAVEVDLAKDESESFQLILIPQGQDLTNVTIKFVSNNSANIEFKWYRVDYVKSGKSVYSPNEENWIPDPLWEVPSLSVSKDYLQPIWITFLTKPTTPAGVYNGYIEVSSSSEVKTIDITIKVRDFIIPRPGTLATPFGNYRKVIEEWYYGRLNVLPKSIYDEWCNFLIQYRLTPKEIGTDYVTKQENIVNSETGEREVVSVDMSALTNMLPKVDNVLPPYTYHFYRLPSGSTLDQALKTPGHWWHNPKKLVDPIWKYKSEWDSRGFTDKTFVYGIDEPNTPTSLDGTVAIYQEIKAVDPNMKIMQTGNCDVPEFIGLVDIYCAHSIRAWRPFFQDRLAAGDTFWQYITISSKEPYANFFIDAPGVNHRNLFWQTRKVGATGFLFWSVFWVNEYYPQAHHNLPTFPDLPWDYTKTDYKTGDGMLVYPSKSMTPIPSIRLKIIQDGIEDYEYFSVLEKIISEVEENDSNRELINEAKSLLLIPNSIVTDNRIYSKDENLLLNYRKRIADMIENLRNLVEGSASNPILINNKQDWLDLIENVNIHNINYSSIYFKLTNNINLEGLTIMPLGGNAPHYNYVDQKPFQGIIDGNNHSITNFKIELPVNNGVGLIGYLDGGRISNLKIENARIEGSDYVGGIAGKVKNSVIENCISEIDVKGNTYVGGIVGGIVGSQVKNCGSYGNVTGRNAVGGIVGHSFPIRQ